MPCLGQWALWDRQVSVVGLQSFQWNVQRALELGINLRPDSVGSEGTCV